MKIEKKKKLKKTGMTLEKLAILTQQGFLELKEEISGVKSDVAELKSNMIELKTDVAKLKTDVAELQTDMIIVKRSVRTLESDMEKVFIELHEIRQEHVAGFGLYKEIEKRTFNHENRIAKIEEKVFVQKHTSK